MSDKLIGKGWAFPPQVDAQGHIALVGNDTELEQSIRIILATQPGERVMRPTFGCRLYELVFMPNNMDTAVRAQEYVDEALGMWEPRIKVQRVAVRPNPYRENELLIEIDYLIKNTRDARSLVHPFYLIPGE